MSRNLFPPTPGILKPTTIVKIINGGTGADNEEDAVLNLGGIPLSHKNASNGVIGLNKLKKIDAGLFNPKDIRDVSVSGNTTVTLNSTNNYTITNYDEFKDYTVRAINGSVSIVNNIVTYIAPDLLGEGRFYINSRLVIVNVVQSVVNKPKITSPITASENIPKSINIIGSAFVVRGAGDSHESSSWQLSLNKAFTNIVTQVTDDILNKTSWLVNNLVENTTYYIRVKYKAVNLDYSEWSDTYTFKTRKSFLPSLPEAELKASDKQTGDQFGFCVNMSDDGTRLVIGAYTSSPSGLVGAGAVYVYKHNGVSWTQEAKLTASDKETGGQFGHSVAISGDGTRIVVGAPTTDASNISNSGCIYIFSRFGTTWSEESIMIASDISINGNLGKAVSIDGTGTRIAAFGLVPLPTSKNAAYMYVRTGNNWAEEDKVLVDNSYTDLTNNAICISNNGNIVAIGSGPTTINAVNNVCSVDVLARSGNSWVKQDKVTPVVNQGFDRFGTCLSINTDGTKLAVGAPARDISGVVNSGAIFIFTKSGVNWTEDSIIVPTERRANDEFGFSVSLNSLGDVIVAGSPSDEVGNLLNSGSAYVFADNGTTWVQKSRLVSLNSKPDDHFGINVTIAADTSKIAIGAYNSDPNNIINAGSTHVFN
jgi:hypothetical protein